MENKKFFSCRCGSFEHTLRIAYIDHADVYIETYLCDLGFWKRLWLGIKYIFGYKSRYGNFAEFILSPEDIKEMKEFIDDYLKYYEEEKGKPSPSLNELYAKLKEDEQK